MRIDEPTHDQDDINALLRQLDHPGPPVSAEVIVARAQGRKPGWGRWAAGILLVAGLGGVAYAVPGSPVPGWVNAVVAAITGPGTPPAPSGPLPPPVPDEAPAGVAVAPGGDFTILFTRTADSGLARITLTGGSDVVVRAPGGAATFTSDIRRLVIDNLPISAVYEISIPAGAPRVEITVQGRRVFLKEGDRVTAEGTTVSSQQYLLPLKP
ncbi:MAG TPA: hypothetical protein VGP80_13465 [Gemmatimonadales bacterium]|nr:hypothetical protein [Gemmatimonadales bacterium]